ncbi:hypothetical protein ACIA5C_19525 [Actinoplanes sp. NPDC051343]|uniref:hypothetical protein n=1 Tax=Actinoplanes sp. NPDC051343 TaxID=3363906 RepID=UPI00378F1136
MRHLRSILYAVVLAPAVWVLVAVGLTHDLTARGRDGFAVESFMGLLMLLLGGAAYGILVFAPISPLGPTAAGVVFFAAGVWAISSPSSYADLWPAGVVKDGFDLSRPGYGLAALLSVPMILTVLSVRRWRGYEPLVLPLIGQIGRAAAPGIPMARMETAVPPVADGAEEAERTTLLRLFEGPEERTTLLKRPAKDGDSTTVVRIPIPTDGESTTIIRSPAASSAGLDAEGPRVARPENGEEPTADVTGDAEPTAAIASEEPTTVIAAGESTVDISAGEPTADVTAEKPTADVTAEETTANVAAEEPTVDVEAEGPTVDAEAEGPVTVAGVEERPTEPKSEGESEGESDAQSAADAEGLDVADEPTDEEPAAADVADDELTTVLVAGETSAAAADDQPVEAPNGRANAESDEETPSDLVPIMISAAEVAEDALEAAEFVEETTYLIVADETQPSFRLPGEETVVVHPAARIPGETTQILGTPGEDTRVIVQRPMDDTQVIRSPDDGERTQLLGPKAKKTGPDRRGSIAGAESPNFADDPTGRLQRPAAQPDEPARSMTVMNIERPPEDPPEIPSPRRSPESDG